MPDTVRIKVTFSIETHQALTALAARLGLPVAVMVADAAVNGCLGTNATLKAIERRLDAIEAGKMPAEAKPEPARLPSGHRVREGASVLMTKSSPVLPDDGSRRQLGLHELAARFEGNGANPTGLLARLCQLGGRKGDLFAGSLPHAQKTAAVTAQLDPDGLSWLPTDPSRRYWVQMPAADYARQILTQSLG